MEIRSIGSSVLRNLKNIRGWTTNRKIIVIESDDWGSIRVPSREVYERFVQHGFAVAGSQYNRLDSLESNQDMTTLFEVLSSVKDIHGNPACLTANTIVANPNFDKIKASAFQQYHYEHFTSTLTRYPFRDQVFELYRYGMKENLFVPQFHGREHLHIGRWMKALRTGEKDIRFSFDQQTTFSGKNDYSFMESLDMDSDQELDQLREIVRDGLRIFEETFGYASKSFIAPCYTWDSRIEEELVNCGVNYLQGTSHQYIPLGGFGNYRTAHHYMGKKNKAELIHIVRNCFFEPALIQKSDWVSYTMAGIADAFRWNKPAVICSHRINFMGSLDESNRINNLKLLKQLLTGILRKWPEVTFMRSDQLGDLIKKGKAHE